MKFSTKKKGFALIGVMIAISLIPILTYVMLHFASMQQKLAQSSRSNMTQQLMYVVKNKIIGSCALVNTPDDGMFSAPRETGADPDNATLPITLSAPASDEWGTPFKYCTWASVGVSTDSLYSQNHVVPPNYDPNQTTPSPLLARIVSAGPDRVFQTHCQSATGDGDDIVVNITQVEIHSTKGTVNGWSDTDTGVTLLDPNDNVGLGGPATPGYKLNVYGNTLVGGDLTTSGGVAANNLVLTGNTRTFGNYSSTGRISTSGNITSKGIISATGGVQNPVYAP